MTHNKESVQLIKNIPYTEKDRYTNRLDLAVPADASEKLPVIIFVHGGGWQDGDKSWPLGKKSLKFFAEKGCVSVSMNYRLSQEATFPAQLVDVKRAIIWLKEHAPDYHIDPERIGIWGHSSGGHLAAMAGLVEDDELENLNVNRKHNGKVHAVVASAAPTDLKSMGGWHDRADSPESKLIGNTVADHHDLANQASPLHYVHQNHPPFLLIHGEKDNIVPASQADILYEALHDVSIWKIKGAGHHYENGLYDWDDILDVMYTFFRRHVIQKKNRPSESYEMMMATASQDLMSSIVRDAEKRGLFEDLPGKGRPIASEQPGESSYEGALYRTLKHNQVLPKWVQLNKEISALKENLGELEPGKERRQMVKAINKKIRSYNMVCPPPLQKNIVKE
ncbi:MAG: DUF1992 domain-containing protein [Bacillaceae bacterium]|nr:DUF1992 domain-containing protein [Bacillaceae bacterium]